MANRLKLFFGGAQAPVLALPDYFDRVVSVDEILRALPKLPPKAVRGDDGPQASGHSPWINAAAPSKPKFGGSGGVNMSEGEYHAHLDAQNPYNPGNDR